MRKKIGLIVAVFLVLAWTVPGMASVNVFVEGAYTDTDLAVYVYANITGDNILSAGVKLTYQTSDLTVTSATKNEDDWYMGDGTTNEAYMDPDTSTPGEVIIICGKLDSTTGHALDGVSGDRVLLGVIRFSRTGSTMPFSPILSIDLGKGGDYDNFVETDGDVLDGTGVTFGTIEVHERGDANGDGNVNVLDMSTIKYFMVNGGDYHCWMDCNDDENINVQDMSCIKYKMTH